MKLSSRYIVSCLLIVTLAIVGCVNVANLISLGTQIAVDVISVIGAFQGQVNPTDIAIAQKIGAEAQKDWTDLQNAYNQYEANKSASNLQNVVNVGATLENNLATLLADSHIENQLLLSRVTAAVDTIITVVDQVAVDLGATIPASPAAKAHSHAITASVGVKAQMGSIKSIWNSAVAGPTGNAAIDAGLAKARL